jgi:nucleoside-triphosphatase THEP1
LPPEQESISIGRWVFDPGTLDWANRVLAAAPPCDLLIVDELGPLELTRGEGLKAAFEVIPQGRYQLAVAVIRPELVAAARSHWRWGQVLPIRSPGQNPKGLSDL